MSSLSTDNPALPPTLRESEAHTAAILAAALDCIVTIDHDDRILEFNPAAEATFGYARADVVGKPMAELLVPPRYRDAHNRGMRHYLATGEGPVLNKRIELEAMRADGSTFPCELAIAPIRVGAHPIFTAYLRDITERKRVDAELIQARNELELRVAERTEELAREKSFLQAVLENIEDGIVACNEHGVLTLFNRATRELHGLPHEPLPADQWADRYSLFGPDGVTPLAVEQVPLFRALAGEHLRDAEMVIAPINGEPRLLAASGQPLYDEAGNKLGAVVSMHDVTDRRHAEEARAEVIRAQAARRTEERLTEILECINDGFTILDAEWRIIYINAAAERLNNQRREDVLGRNHWDVYPAAVGTVLHTELCRVSAEQVTSHFENHYAPWDRWFELDAYPTKDGGVAISYRDITGRKRAETRRDFLAALSAATQPLVNSDEMTAVTARLLREYLDCDRCAYAEVEEESVFVITGDDVRIMGDDVRITGDDVHIMGDGARSIPSIVGRWPVAAFGAECERLMLAGEPYVVTDVDHDPHLTPADLAAYRATTIRSVICVPLHKNGVFTAAMAVHQQTARSWTPEEVSLVQLVVNRSWESLERARVTRDLQTSEAKFRQLANTIPQLAWMANPDGAIFWYNDRWYQYTGSTPHDMQGWGWQDVHDPETLPAVMEQWLLSIETGAPFDMTFPLRGADGQFRPFLTRVNPLRDTTGQVVLWFGTNTDVSERAKLDEERKAVLEAERAARADAERLSQMKDEFLATLSHELRTPLNAILGYATLLRSVEMSAADQQEAASVIERNAKAQAQIIEDLLDMNRIIAGKIRLDVQQLSLPAVIDSAIETVKPTADARGIRIEKLLDPLAGPVRGDPARLQQVVWNLLANALKFTDKGGKVQISLHRINSHVEIAITDTGQGIAPEFLPHVFDRFRQADSSMTRRHGGLGLGLAIVKQLVEVHGGCVTAASPGLGRGATFVVALPVAVVHEQVHQQSRTHPRSSTPNPPHDGRPDLHGVHVLVVDDDHDSCNLVQRILNDCGADSDTAYSAAEGFAKLGQQRYDVLVSDIGMPGEDGYDFLRRVRALPRESNGPIAAVALTAFARSEDRRRAALAGFQTHVAKPVEPAELAAIVASLAGRIR